MTPQPIPKPVYIEELEAENKRLREGIEFIAGYAAGLRESLTHGEDSATEEAK